jgi:hypothetical protein
VLHEDSTLGRLLTPVFDDNARAANDLAGVALTVKLAETSPLAELLSVRHLDQRDLLIGLIAESLDKANVRLLVDRVAEDSHMSLARRESLGGLTETTGKTVVDKGLLQDATEGILNGHATRGSGLGNRDLDLLSADFPGVRLLLTFVHYTIFHGTSNFITVNLQ